LRSSKLPKAIQPVCPKRRRNRSYSGENISGDFIQKE
jgi:hypothetical protein